MTDTGTPFFCGLSPYLPYVPVQRTEVFSLISYWYRYEHVKETEKGRFFPFNSLPVSVKVQYEHVKKTKKRPFTFNP
jgi:hypothetical protein